MRRRRWSESRERAKEEEAAAVVRAAEVVVPGSARAEQSVLQHPGAVRLEGRLDLEALERVINEIVRRHEVLRTRFEVEAGEPVQVIDDGSRGDWKSKT